MHELFYFIWKQNSPVRGATYFATGAAVTPAPLATLLNYLCYLESHSYCLQIKTSHNEQQRGVCIRKPTIIMKWTQPDLLMKTFAHEILD